MNTLYCQFCNASGFKQIKTHERQCKMNPDRTSAAGHIGKNQYDYGAVCSTETRKKISDSAKLSKHSAETKAKLSNIRIEYLSANPDKVPYRMNHSSKISYPELYFRECFANTVIVAEHRVGRYSLDFANVDKKIYFEVDGEQHYVDPRIIENDKRRTLFLSEEGWTMHRVRWAEFQRLNSDERKLYVAMVKKNMGV